MCGGGGGGVWRCRSSCSSWGTPVCEAGTSPDKGGTLPVRSITQTHMPMLHLHTQGQQVSAPVLFSHLVWWGQFVYKKLFRKWIYTGQLLAVVPWFEESSLWNNSTNTSLIKSFQSHFSSIHSLKPDWHSCLVAQVLAQSFFTRSAFVGAWLRQMTSHQESGSVQ